MRRKFTLPVEPPVAMMSAVILCSKSISTPALRAATSSGIIKPWPDDVVAWIAGSRGLPSWTRGQSIAALCTTRIAELPADTLPISSGG